MGGFHFKLAKCPSAQELHYYGYYRAKMNYNSAVALSISFLPCFEFTLRPSSMLMSSYT